MTKVPKKYLTDLQEVPKEHRALFHGLNQVIESSFAQPGQLKKFGAGWYYLVTDGQLVKVTYEDGQEFKGSPKGWHAVECSPRADWYTDHYDTLKELKACLGI